MGQYYLVVNPDREEYLHPHRFGDGLKLMEFANSRYGVLLGLAVVLAQGNGKGLGDLRSDRDVVGSWAGDRVVVAGDYGETGEHGAPDGETLYSTAKARYDDISDEVIRAVVEGEGDNHPLANLDMDDDGWRSRSG